MKPAGRPEGTIAIVRASADISLRGPRVEAAPGDVLLRHAGRAAVVSTSGRIVDFGSDGAEDQIVSIEPAVFAGLAPEPVASVRIVPTSGAVLIQKRLTSGLQLDAWVYFSGDVLVLETRASAFAVGAPAVTLGEVVEWGNVPTWIEGNGWVRGPGTYAGDFIAREAAGTAYALCADRGRIQARVPELDLPGFHPPVYTGEETVALAPGDRTPLRVVYLSHSDRSLGDAALALPCVARSGLVDWEAPATAAPRARVEAARCDGRPWALFTPGRLRTPSGCFALRLAAPGHAPGAWIRAPGAAAGPDAQPRAGTLRFSVTEPGRGPIPARVLVRGRAGTPDPSWGEGPDRGAALNVIYAERGVGEHPLPPGRYRVTVDRGFEYTLHEQEIDVAAGERVVVDARLVRVVDTRGWIAADLHLHAAPSPDAPTPLHDRIRSLVAVGVEVAVATDHNAVTDYAPTIREMGLGPWIASIVGNEVTTKEVLLGHFNLFPLAANSAVIEWRRTTPHRIFAAARASRPYGKDTVIQVNHPRMRDLGYFELLRFDPGDVPGWRKRTPLAHLGFDAIEVFNGDHYDLRSIHKVDECLRDWYALLNAGYRYTATGNSDSHKLTYHEAGVPRNLVAIPNDDPAAFDERAFVDAVRAGRVVVSSGPFIRLRANGRDVGETVPAGDLEVEIEVQAPPWVEVDLVQLVRRGEVLREWRGDFGASNPRFRRREHIPLRPGDWIIALAQGSRPMTHLHRPDAVPFGFTNPIWVARP